MLFPQTLNAKESYMISVVYDINTFIGQVQDKPFEEVILLAQDEATAAERVCLREHMLHLGTDNAPYTYACQLKGVIQYLRYGTVSSILKDNPIDSLEKVRETRFCRHKIKPH